MQRHPVRKPFNLVEITLAMGVIGMGIAGVMALFQLGMSHSRDAVGDNYAADAAEIFIAYITQMAAVDSAWDASGLKGSLNIVETDNKPDPTATTDVPSYSGWAAITGTNLWSCSVPVRGLFRLTQGSATVTDFDAVIRVWQTQIGASSASLNEGIYIGASHQDIDDRSYGVGINVEVSWPRGKPYASREKRYYYFEVFNPNKI